MAKSLRILSRSLLVAGMSGFPVGIASFVKNSRFEAQKLYPILDEINKEEAFLAEYRQEKQTIENTTKPEIETINSLQAELASENKTASDGIGAQTKSVSEELKKAMMVKLQPCTKKDELGLKEITKKFQVQGQTISITYCYFPECDQNLFSKKANSFAIGKESQQLSDYKWFSRSCYSAIINHDVSSQKITGRIQWGLKNNFATELASHKKKYGWRGVLFSTEFKFSNDKTSDKFKNKLITLEKIDSEWKDIGNYGDWDDTHKNQYTYDSLKNKLQNEYTKLNFWLSVKDKRTDYFAKSSQEVAGKEDETINSFFDKGSDLWRWNNFGSTFSKHSFRNYLVSTGWEIVKYHTMGWGLKGDSASWN